MALVRLMAILNQLMEITLNQGGLNLFDDRDGHDPLSSAEPYQIAQEDFHGQ
jgi:hypothetical protein